MKTFDEVREMKPKPRGWARGVKYPKWQLPDDHELAAAEMHYAYGDPLHPSIEEAVKQAIRAQGVSE